VSGGAGPRSLSFEYIVCVFRHRKNSTPERDVKAPERGEESEVFRIRKSADEWLVGRLRVLNGKVYADLRLFFENDAGEEHATKKGVCFAADLLVPLLKGIGDLATVAATWTPADPPTGNEDPAPNDSPEPGEAPL